MSYSGYGVMPEAPQWPAYGPLQQPQSSLWYSYAAAGETVNNTDPLTLVAASVAPSGTGEVAIGGVSVSGDTISVLMTGGVAGRRYTVKLLMTTQSQQTYEALIALPIDPTLASYPLVEPPTAGFGPSTNWPPS